VAERSGASLRYSAAVGGSAPMIEAVRRQANRGEIVSISGILNGTCNYLLDRCSEGLSLEEAVIEAQAKGFAEADLIVENTFHTQVQEQAFLEPEAGIAWVDENDVINIRVSTQVVEHFRAVADALGVPHNRVQVKSMFVGGGFGGKENITVELYEGLSHMNTSHVAEPEGVERIGDGLALRVEESAARNDVNMYSEGHLTEEVISSGPCGRSSTPVSTARSTPNTT